MRQSYKNIEIIVADDNSTDGSVEIVQEMQDDDERIFLICNKINKGLTATVNDAVGHAKGNFLLVLGHDDLLAPKHIETLVSCFEANDSMVYCNTMLIDENNAEKDFLKIPDNNRTLSLFDFSVQNCIQSCGLLMSMDKFVQAGMFKVDQRWRNYGEWHLWIRMLKLGNIRFCPDIHSYYRRHSTNMTNQFTDPAVFKLHRSYCLECMKLAHSLDDFNLTNEIRFRIIYAKYFLRTYLTYVRSLQ
jgi:glycosyltransferase involved in cell wall biosynthesis